MTFFFRRRGRKGPVPAGSPRRDSYTAEGGGRTARSREADIPSIGNHPELGEAGAAIAEILDMLGSRRRVMAVARTKIAGDVERMGKAVLRTEALEALVLGELTKRPRCSGARSVIIRPCVEPHPATRAYWAPAHVNPGTSGIEVCQRELWRVCERLGRDYELAP